jgi:multimeric flavodoxin WrbA
MSKTIYILYYSRTGNVKTIADKILDIFSSLGTSDVELKLMNAKGIDLEALILADGYIIGTPNYFGASSGYIKVFFDELYQVKQIQGKPIFFFVSHGGGGDIEDLEMMRKALKLKAVGSSIVVRRDDITEDIIKNIELNLKILMKSL